mmetsp:Transcript_18568/g.17889  ORF Transcript_18568/g.17889 Transcript_18568/m.17889 type:complete len:144 (+) Transcript_18568:388-819(+)|eukprot:CAMPEP_0119039196 /NCGR_PEP_ID=MMETSP1177-20130426/8573_1 /TAXON_ID=2985 /ORGANISM="Ochromonas sp, Strain CCMP1899" /LENGTH=143 /DNA_ID=CAMNT_0007002797 /DNA_START=314 /DNA_END=745 /DNA_ORIENTATION=-
MSQSRPPKPIAPDIDGYLDKLKHKTSLFGSWSRRYFRVNVSGDKIEYYSNQKAAEKTSNVSGVIHLANFRGVKKFDNVTFQLDGGIDGVYLLRADSNAELACWLNALENYLREKMDYDRYLEAVRANKRREQSEREEDNIVRK